MKTYILTASGPSYWSFLVTNFLLSLCLEIYKEALSPNYKLYKVRSAELRNSLELIKTLELIWLL